MKTDLRDYSKGMGAEESSDPLVLLKSLSSMLTIKGGISGTAEASKIVGMMRNSKKLVNRCIFLNILRVTSDEEIYEKFIADGGWKIMNKWLSEAKESENNAVILEILKLLQRLPLKIQHLRENNTPKIIKHYAKSPNPKLKTVASSLMSSWMAIIRGSSAGPEAEAPKKKKDKKKMKSFKNSNGESTKTKNSDKDKNSSVPVLKAPSFAKFRKTGLETDEQLKKKVKPKPAPAGKRNSVDNDKECPVPEKKIKPNAEAKPKKITISEGFMDALNSASNPIPIAPKKIKRKPVKPPTASASAGNSDKPLEYATGDANDFSATELLRKISPKRNTSPVPTEPPKPKLNKYGKPRKMVRWHADETLESIRYFEVDENERVNVTKIPFQEYTRIQIDDYLASRRVNVSTQSFKDAQHREMMIERQLLKGKMPHLGDDKDGGSWRKPYQIEPLEILVVPGCNSVEKDIQTEREKTVLMEIFLTKDMVPDSPAEPDPEPYEITQPKIIPFDDENSILESMEPEGMDQENNVNNGNDLVKNMLGGVQQQNPDGDLTAKLKQILETATAITNTNNGKQTQNGPMPNQVPQGQMMPDKQNGMLAMHPGNQQMMPMQPNMDMTGQNGPMPPMGFYGGPMMVPMQDPNFYGQNWVGPPPQHQNGPLPPNGPPPPMMGPRPGMNGPSPPYQPDFNPNWNGPKWGPRGGPPRQDFRNHWRGRWDDNRRRRR